MIKKIKFEDIFFITIYVSWVTIFACFFIWSWPDSIWVMKVSMILTSIVFIMGGITLFKSIFEDIKNDKKIL